MKQCATACQTAAPTGDVAIGRTPAARREPARARIAAVAVAAVALAGCYKLPPWRGSVDVSPIERAAVSTCGAGAVTADGSRLLQRRPYQQSVGADRAVIAWAAPPSAIAVELTLPSGAPIAEVAGRYAGDPRRRERRASTSSTGDAGDFYVQRADVGGLRPATLYCYRLVRGDVALTRPAPLRTAPAANHDRPVRFVALGDSGTGSDAQRAIAARLSEARFEMMLFFGDIAYKSGTPEQLQSRFFEIYADYLAFTPAFPVIGNHDRATRDGQPFFEAFVLPDRESYYSFDWGDIHFVAFDTTDRSRAQIDWLESDLAANRRTWTIAFGHHPLYSNSFRGPQQRIRRRFETVFRRHGVDLVLAGHEHHYERFEPIGGVTYVVSGGGGGRLTRTFTNTQAAKQAAVHHYLTFEVTRRRLAMTAVDIDGAILDELVLDRESRPLASRRSRKARIP